MEQSQYEQLDAEASQNATLRAKIRTALRCACNNIRRRWAKGDDTITDVQLKFARYVLNKPDHEVDKVLGLFIAEHADRPGDVALAKDHQVQAFVDEHMDFLVAMAAPGPIVGGG